MAGHMHAGSAELVLWISGAVAAAGAMSHLLAYQVRSPVLVALAFAVRIAMVAHLPLAALMVVIGEGLFAVMYMGYPILALVIVGVFWPLGTTWNWKRPAFELMGATQLTLGVLLTVASAVPCVPAAASVVKWHGWATANQSTTLNNLEDAYQRGIHGQPNLLYALSSNPGLPERLCAGILEHVASADDPDTKINLVDNPACPAKTWTALAKDRNPHVRAHLVRSARCPDDVLAQLATDTDERVRAALAERRARGAAGPDGGPT